MKKRNHISTRLIAVVLAGLAAVLAMPMQTMGALAASAAQYENGFSTANGAYEPAKLNNNGTKNVTTDDYYEIANAGQLFWFSALVNGGERNVNAKLTANIVVNTGDVQNCNGEKAADWVVWEPIGFQLQSEETEYAYTGAFDGQGHTVSGLFFSYDMKSYAGLFGRVEGGSIQNVGVMNSYLYGWYNVGGICGVMKNGEITNCYNTGAVRGGTQNVGGVCGYFTTSTIRGSYNTGTVSCRAGGAGGVVGVNSDGVVVNCYNIGAVFGAANTGGVCGANYDGTIVNSYSTGIIKSDSSKGGICAWNKNGTVANCYFDATIFEGNAIEKGNGGEDENPYKATTDFKDGTIAKLLNGGCTVDGTSYTGAGWEQRIGYDEAPVFAVAPAQKNGAYLLENVGDLYWFSGLVNGTLANTKQNTDADATLIADIVVNTGDVAGCGGVKADGWIGWMPIGNSSDSFKGTFDGQGHTISGLYGNDESQNDVGLFGRIGASTAEQGSTPCVIQNVSVVNDYFSGKTNVGGVCGYSDNGAILNSYHTGTVTGSNNVGGVSGWNSGTITNSYSIGTVKCSGSNAGGVCGYHDSGRIENSYFNSTVYAGDAIGYHSGVTDTTVTGKTSTQFSSGEVAYLLHNGTGGTIWGQNIGTDEIPLLDSAKPAIYKATFDYDNTNFTAEMKSIDTYTNGIVNFTVVPKVTYFTLTFLVGNVVVSTANPYGITKDTIFTVKKAAVPVQATTGTVQLTGAYQNEITDENADLSNFVKNADAVGGVSYQIADGSTLPVGLTLNSATGKIAGTPMIAVPDGKNVTVVVTAKNGATANLIVHITIQRIDPVVTPSIPEKTYHEGEKIPDISLSKDDTAGTIRWINVVLDSLNAGENVLTWEFVPEDENYNIATGTNVIHAETTTIRAIDVTDGETKTVAVGETIQMVCDVPSDTGTIQWESSDSGVAVIDKNGVVTILDNGVVVITATTEAGESYAIELSVVDTALQKGDADRNGEIAINDSFQVLMYNSQHSAGNVDYTFQDDANVEGQILTAVDIDADGEITIRDAYLILMYTSYHAAGQDITWEGLLEIS